MTLEVLAALGLTVLLTVFAGCRIGNRVEEAPPPPQTFTGFYQAEFIDDQALSFCFTDDQGTETCEFRNAAENLPEEIAAVMRNPVALQVMNIESREAGIFDPYGSGTDYFVVTMGSVFASANSTSLVGKQASSTIIAWNDPNCTFRRTRSEVGTVTRGAGGVVNNLSTSGRIALDIETRSLFESVDPLVGDCSASLQAMHGCYLNLASCGTNPTQNQAFVQAIFGESIAVGLISAADIPVVRALKNIVRYQ